MSFQNATFRILRIDAKVVKMYETAKFIGIILYLCTSKKYCLNQDLQN